MKVSQRFTIADSPERVWRVMSDVRDVVTCVPGLEMTKERDDGAYLGRFSVKVGPLSAKLDGEGVLSRDDAALSAKVEGRGVDKRGGSRAKGTMRYVVTKDPEGAAVEIEADFTLSGPLAQVGRTGIIEDVARSLTQEFAGNLATRLAGASERPPQQAIVGTAGSGEEPDSAASGAAPTASSVGQRPAARQFDVGSALSHALWRRVLNFLKRLLGLSRRRQETGSGE